MDALTTAERELVALGAALGSNCVGCIEHHVPMARKSGLTDRQIDQAIRLADKIRQVPAGKVLGAALGLLHQADGAAAAEESGCGCGSGADDARTDQPCLA